MSMDRSREGRGEIVGGGVVGVQVCDEDAGEDGVDVSGVERGVLRRSGEVGYL